jgi:peptide/nickel transport system substrate-binding protein
MPRIPVGMLSRRQFGRAAAALGLVSSSIPALLLSNRASRAQGVKGGRLKAGMSEANATDTLDPAKLTSSIDIMRGMQLYNRLINLTPDMVPHGELAESFESNATADEWVITLRKGVTYHDGRSLRATDVMYSLKRLVDPANGSAAKTLFDQIDMNSSRADGDLVVRLKMKQRNADMPAMFHDWHAQIVPEGTTNFDKGIGTGPFTLKSFDPGVSSIVVRNPNYWKSNLPYLDEVETVGIPDATARLNALIAGEIDLMEGVEGPVIQKVASDPSLQLLSAKSGRHLVFAMNTQTSPFTNQDVRNGLKYLVDRQKYVEIVLKGQGTVANDHPISPVDPWYCADIPIRGYDPDKAKFLLKKGGAEGMTFNLSAAPVAANMLEATLFVQQLAAQGGVKINVVREAADSFWSNVWLKRPWVTGTWNQRPTADIMLSTAYLSDAPWNETHWKRPAFDKLVLEARGTLDVAKRKEMYCECQRMIHDDGGASIAAFQNVIDAAAKRVKGTILHPLGSLGYWQSEGLWTEA